MRKEVLADPTKSFAVLIGTQHYKHLEDLPAVGNNIDRLRQLLTGAEIWGLPENRCMLLRQPTSASDTVDAVVDAAARATDTLIFYYAGHGLTAPKTMELGLALVESRINAPHTVLPFEWIRQAVLGSKASRKVVILDCCYSGRAFTGGMGGVAELAEDAEIEGTYLLAAAAETKKALAPPGENYTAFTGELVQILQDGIIGGPEFLDMDSIYERAHALLAGKSRPIPQQRNRNSVGRIAFARNKAYAHTDEEEVTEYPAQDSRARSLSGLADTLRLKAQSASDLTALDEAVALYREAIQMSRQGAADYPLHLANLGDALRLKAEMTGDQTSLMEAVAVLRDAVTATPDRHAHRPICLTALGNALRLRAQATGDSGALSEAVQILRAAVEASEPGRPDQAISLLSLGSTLWGVAATSGEPETLDDALTSWEDASHIDGASVRVRIEAASRSGHAAIERGEITRGSAGLALAVSLLPKLASWNIDLVDRERQLADFLGLASDAAAAQLMLGAPSEALELLERGRSVLFSKLLELKPDLGALRMAAPDFATIFQSLVHEVSVDWLTLGEEQESSAFHPPPVIEGPAADSRHSAAHRLEELIERIRSLPGFEQFLRPLSLEQILRAGQDAPVVVVNISRYRSDALILTAGGLHVVPLPDLGAEVVNSRVVEFLRSVRDFGQGGNFESQVIKQQRVRATLEWLWDSLAEPVLSKLGYNSVPSGGEKWPRLFWCPTGLLSLLPIHAAGYHSLSPEGIPRTVIDRVVSSYTTTLRDLLLSRTTSNNAFIGENPDLLIVSLPTTPGVTDLPGAAEEARFLSSLFPDTTVLSGREATRAAVRRALPMRRWAHFACHATSDIDHPVNSGLVLSDGLLSVRDICKIELDSAELIVLSGCETGQPGIDLADEAIHIASAFQIAGCRHIIGTLWPIVDQVAARFAELFYAGIHPEGSDPAFALHVATRTLREMHLEMPIIWAPLTHLGPSHSTPGESLVMRPKDDAKILHREMLADPAR